MHIKWLANASLEGRNFRNRFSFKKKHWKRKFFPPSKRDLILICSLASSTVANRISPLLILVSLDSCAPTPALFTSLDSDFLSSADSFLLHLLSSPSRRRCSSYLYLIPIARPCSAPGNRRWRRRRCGSRRSRGSARSAPTWRRISHPTLTRPASGSSSSSTASSPTSTIT